MFIEDVRHHYGHHHNDEGPDLATGAYYFRPLFWRVKWATLAQASQNAPKLPPAQSGVEPRKTREVRLAPN